MNKKIAITLAVAAGVLFNVADASGKKKKDNEEAAPKAKVELKTPSDSLSYAAGMVRTEGLLPFLQQSFGVDTAYMADFIRGYEDAWGKGFDERMKAYYAGEQIALMMTQRILPMVKEEFEGREDSINEAVLNEGFMASLRNDTSVMTGSFAGTYFDAAFKRAVDDRNAAHKKAGEDFLAANKMKPGVVTLPSGLQYKVLVKGNGAVPKATDEVEVKYEGRLVDGTVFDSSSRQKDGVVKLRVDRLIKGWTEALTIMPVGSKWQLYIPYELAYGERKAGNIEPYSALVFDLELVGISTKETKPKAATTPNAAAKAKHGK